MGLLKKKKVEKPDDEGPLQYPELDLSINKYKLEEEWAKQPQLRQDWGIKLADAKRDAEMAKNKVKVVEAEVKLDIRQNPDDYWDGKITEDVVASLALKDGRLKAAKKQEADTKHQVDVLQAVVAALEHRKHAIGDMVDLTINEYYSNPKTNFAKRMEARDDKRKDRVRQPRDEDEDE